MVTGLASREVTEVEEDLALELPTASLHPGQVMHGSRVNNRGRCPPDTFIRCFEAGRYGPASKTHFARACPFPANPRNNLPMQVLLIPAQGTNSNTASIQEVQISPAMLQQAQTELKNQMSLILMP